MDKRYKIIWWQVLLCLIVFPTLPIYFIYKSKGLTNKKRWIITGVYLFLLIPIFSALEESKGSPIESVSINDIILYKDDMFTPEVVASPEKSKVDSIKIKIEDTSVANVQDGKVVGLKQGQTTYTCEVKDAHNNLITSPSGIITVNLTEEQQAEETSKLEQELQEKRNTLSNERAVKIKDYCKSVVDSILKAPSTAKYPGTWLSPLDGWQMSISNNLVTVKAYVDSQNGFGAMIRSPFIIQVQLQDDGSGTASYVEFDGSVLSGTLQ